MSLLDIIGPVMVGPSSSHTAGACRVALLARHALALAPKRAKLELHGSFAKTGRGHGTHLALVAGLLGCYPDDPRIPRALEEAEANGLEVAFEERDLGDVHPNTVRITLEAAGEPGGGETAAPERVSVTGSSLGAGLVRIVKVNGYDSNFSGSYHTLLIEHEDRPGVIARAARVLADDEVNIATIYSARQRRGGSALMSVEMDRRPARYALEYLAHLPYIRWSRTLPEVMSGGAQHDPV